MSAIICPCLCEAKAKLTRTIPEKAEKETPNVFLCHLQSLLGFQEVIVPLTVKQLHFPLICLLWSLSHLCLQLATTPVHPCNWPMKPGEGSLLV